MLRKKALINNCIMLSIFKDNFKYSLPQEFLVELGLECCFCVGVYNIRSRNNCCVDLGNCYW